MRRFMLALVLVGACGSNVIDAAHYDRSCVTVADCAFIRAGDVCSGCDCINATINQRDLAHYTADLHRIDCGMISRCGACAGIEATCDSGVCGVRQGVP
jgi:hypothetical protein